MSSLRKLPCFFAGTLAVKAVRLAVTMPVPRHPEPHPPTSTAGRECAIGCTLDCRTAHRPDCRPGTAIAFVRGTTAWPSRRARPVRPRHARDCLQHINAIAADPDACPPSTDRMNGSGDARRRRPRRRHMRQRQSATGGGLQRVGVHETQPSMAAAAAHAAGRDYQR